MRMQIDFENNCIPCYKGGKSHWHKVWKYYRDRFDRAMLAEERASNTVFDGISLRELSEQWEKGIDEPSLFEEEEGMPCMCAF